jgi:hypothetical protein
MQLSPFMAIGQPFAINTNGTGSTSQSTLVPFNSIGIVAAAKPTQVRFLNKGTADIWASITDNAAAAVLPVAGTTTIGTPGSLGAWWIEPGVDLIFTFAAVVGGPNSARVNLNTISTGVSQLLYVQFGEGA